MTLHPAPLDDQRTLIADRRRHERTELSLPALLRVQDLPGAVIGRTLDLSNGGALLRLPRQRFLPLGTRVVIGLAHTPDCPAQFIRETRHATVVRCLAHDAVMHVAVHFDAARPLAAAG